MNTRAVFFLLGCVGLIMAAFLLVPAGVSLAFGQREEAAAFALSALTSAAISGALALRFRGATKRKGQLNFFRREGLAAVGLSWILGALLGALPFVYTGFLDPIDAIFESASGLTTTGSTILTGAHFTDLAGYPGLGFWRSFTHWIGGVGIVLVFVVLFPTGGRSLFRSEVPGVAREASARRVRDSAITLLKIYVGLTAVQMGLLVIAQQSSPLAHVPGAEWGLGMHIYEAALHSFGTLATGGFSNHGGSVADFQSVGVEMVILVFMFLAGINFAFYDLGLRKGLRKMWSALVRSTEVQVYAGLIFLSIVVISGVLWFWGGPEGDPDMDYSSLPSALRASSFLVVSLQTSTGYGTEDFDRWPEFCRMLLMFLAFVGATAGSTGGGLKVIRFLILAKAAWRGVRRFARPRGVYPVRMSGETLDESVVASVVGYCGMWVLLFVGGTLALSGLQGLEPTSAATSVLATLNNIGPGLNMVGPAENFSFFGDASKLLLSMFMILGRLELYAILVLLSPRFWKQ